MLANLQHPAQTPDATMGLQSIQAVAKYLSLSRSKVYQLMDGGHLPYVKFGRSRRVRWADVLRLVEENLKSQ